MNKRNPSVKCTFVIPDTHMQSPVNGGLVAPDFCHDPAAISLVLQVAKDRSPDEIIHLGDICEMALISEWNKKVHKEGLVKGNDGRWYDSAWSDTMNMVKVFWEYIAKTHPKAEKHQLEGNHDFWSDIAFTNPTLAPFAKDLAFRNQRIWNDCNIKYYPYNGDQKAEQPWVDVGRVRVLHGYNNSSVKRMRLEHDNVMYGHQHKILYDAWDANSREMRRAWCIGCLTKLKADYNSRGGAQNGWAQAFGVIYTMPDGTFSVRVVEITNGKIVDFDGKSYCAKPLSELDKSLKMLELPNG
jgi:predicted phosphodiesterase